MDWLKKLATPCLIASLLGLPTSLFAGVQEANFIAAKRAINKGQWDKFHAIKAQLHTHPLKPYLDYYHIDKTFATIDDDKIYDFITKHPKSPMAAKLRRKLIKEAAQNQQWNTIIEVYKPTTINTYRCHYYNALLHNNQQDRIQQEMISLWLTGKSLPESCTQAFETWLLSHPNKKALLWQRFELALSKYNFKLAKHLMTHMSPKTIAEANAILRLYKSPQLVTKASYIRNQPSAEVISYGIFRLARRDPGLAISTWKKLKSKYHFNDKQQQRMFQAIALRYALRKNKKSGIWFRKVIGKPLLPVYQEWMIRSALIQRDWQLVKDGIEGMPKEQQQLSRWQYWHARALEKLGKKEQAQQEFKKIAKIRDYHGFLAALRNDKTLKVKHAIPEFNQQDIEQVKHIPAFKRAKHLYQLNQKYEARLELYYLMKHSDEKQQYLITKLVADWGWDTQALHLTRYADHKDDIKLRFPLHYHDTVLNHAQKRRLPPELIYAIIRQESFFVPKAKSHAGAMGLMQLMPATAYKTSKQYNLSYKKSDLLKGKTNIELGSAHLRHLHKKLNNHPILVIAAYNAGRNAVNRWLPKSQKMPADIWIETIPFYETRKYVRHVIAYYVVYQQRLGKSPNIDNIMRSI